MERLTERDGLLVHSKLSGEFGSQTILQALADYEDLEEQVLKSTGTDLASMVGEFMYYYNLKKENRLLELPCKVGDTVYSLTPFCEICERFFDISYACEDCNQSEFATETKFDYEMIPMFGKSVFLTKEEAEKALAEMEK